MSAGGRAIFKPPSTAPYVVTSIAQRIADELRVRVSRVDATIALLDDKSTVPFIARYRKEATGGLDDTQLRALEDAWVLRELEEVAHRSPNSIAEQGKMTPELAAAIAAADTKARLEDLFLPCKPKRRTKAPRSPKKPGLEPLALGHHLALLSDAVRDGGASILELAEVSPGTLGERAQLRVVEAAGGFLAIAGDKGDGGLVVQQGDRRVYLGHATRNSSAMRWAMEVMT